MPPTNFGAVAHLGERIVRNDEVAGSTPVCSTSFVIRADPKGKSAVASAARYDSLQALWFRETRTIGRKSPSGTQTCAGSSARSERLPDMQEAASSNLARRTKISGLIRQILPRFGGHFYM